MNTVRFGIIGLGNMGSGHAGYIDTIPGAKLAAICDTDAGRRDNWGSKLKVPTYASYTELLNSGSVDAIIIAVPHYDHPPIAKAAFAKGIHVLCEKPVCVTVGEARKLNEAYKPYADNVTFAIMFNQRTDPKYVKMRELITSGELGEISRITWIVTDWLRTWTYYASGGWRATWAGEGGGVLINQCPHNLDLLQWITGLMPSRVTAVCNIAKRHPIEVEDEVAALLEYPNGALGQFVTTTGEAPGMNRLEIAGDRGLLIAEGQKLTYRRLRTPVSEILEHSKESFVTPEVWTIDVPFTSSVEAQHKQVTINFVQHLLKGEPLIAEGIEGVRGLEIGNAMLMSGLTGTRVELPMDGEKFEAFIQDLAKKYGGKKTLGVKKDAVVNMAASFR